VHVRFLLGPAGSGKTFRCLAEIRAALAQAPANPLPLILLAPKQATFQLERQLLAHDSLAGFSRLRVLSFDRLANFIFETLRVAPPRLLSAEGRLMVLRALLRQHDSQLKCLRGSARQAGFAQELGGQLAELQQQQIGPTKLRALAAAPRLRPELRDKLNDLALLHEQYSEWLRTHDLQDIDSLLDAATGRLHAGTQAERAAFAVGGLWLDGFAEMTPQEQALLSAVIPCCQLATLAFCLDGEPSPTTSWLSIWSAIGKTFQQCRGQLSALPGCTVETEVLERNPSRSRFPENSALATLEEEWSLPVTGGMEPANSGAEISVTKCADPEAEAVLAARAILQFVRQDLRHRFRDCAVLVRDLEHHHRPLARMFRRFGIPFFLDRRENVAHHPLAEVTRSALRTAAFDWPHDDWFAALKAGFTPLPENEIDRLENQALEFGWRGKHWREPLPDITAEQLRGRLIGPYTALHQRLSDSQQNPTGPELAGAITALWADLDVESVLEDWTQTETGAAPVAGQPAALHQTVLDQMKSWLANVALAFPRERLPLRDWLQVLDAGLAALTVGVIPPALDEVLVGAIDRARNPDLKFALLLGFNESVFPAPPVTPAILTRSDREELFQQNVLLGPHVQDQISREHYLGYIACTRASRRLAISFSRQDARGRTLNPSSFIAHLQARLPGLSIREFAAADWSTAEHVSELADRIAPAADSAGELPEPLRSIPAVKSFAAQLAQLREPSEAENLTPAVANRLYGPVLKSSVSRLEEFAQCPFRFFVHVGLAAEERKRFELDARERGSFQHEVLEKFHHEVTAEKQRWRDLTPAEARERIGRIATELAPVYRQGLLRVDHKSRFAARALTLALQDFVEVLVTWMREQYHFDPAQAEVGFGLEDAPQPAWELDLGQGHRLAFRGRVDRIDLCPAGERSLAVVMDYKSSSRKLDNVLVENGVQLQLLAYLAVVRRWPAAFLGVKQLVPAGVFYVNLRGQFEGGASRTEVLAEAEAARRQAYRHTGRFDTAWLDQLDRSRAGDQFNYILNKDGSVRSNCTEALAGGEFAALLAVVEAQLRRLGTEIFAGRAAVDPYRKGTVTACEHCEYRAVCRIDDWTHEFRELRAAAKPADAPA
jgi:ATP-dependent helicase/nuclease subunit B